jgi:hypothetical protein
MRSYKEFRAADEPGATACSAVQCSWSAREHLHGLGAGYRHQLFQPLKRAAGALEPVQDVTETQGDSGWCYLSREGSSAGDQEGALSHTTAAGRKAGHTERNAANVKAPVLLCRWTMMRWKKITQTLFQEAVGSPAQVTPVRERQPQARAVVCCRKSKRKRKTAQCTPS